MFRHYHNAWSYGNRVSCKVQWDENLSKVFWRRMAITKWYFLLDWWTRCGRGGVSIVFTRVVAKRDVGAVGEESHIRSAWYQNHLVKHHMQDREKIINMPRYTKEMMLQQNQRMLYSNSAVLMSPLRYAPWTMGKYCSKKSASLHARTYLTGCALWSEIYTHSILSIGTAYRT